MCVGGSQCSCFVVFGFVLMCVSLLDTGDAGRQRLGVVRVVVGYRASTVRCSPARHPRTERSRHQRNATPVGRRETPAGVNTDVYVTSSDVTTSASRRVKQLSVTSGRSRRTRAHSGMLRSL